MQLLPGVSTDVRTVRVSLQQAHSLLLLLASGCWQGVT
jgi:hypothetical protein